MDAAVIRAVKDELGILDAKATALRAVIALYEDGSLPTPARDTQVYRALVANRKASNNAAAVIEEARRLCDYSLDPVPTRAILEAVEARGVSIAGDVPQNVVSSILSRSPEFKSNGRLGWTLLNGNEASVADAADASETGLEGL